VNLRRRPLESAPHYVLCALLIMTTLLSLTRGMVLNSGIYRYRSFHRVAPLVRSHQTVLSSVARARTSSASTASSSSESTSSEEARIRQPLKTLFDLELPEGRCLGLRIDASQQDALSAEAIASSSHWIHACLHPDEVQYAMAQPSEYTQQTFLLGRLAMRQVLDCDTAAAILKDDHGRPDVPLGYLGSISHKRSNDDGTTGVALLSSSPESAVMGVGVDIELALSRRRSIAKRVLTENEISELGRIEVSF